MKKNDHIVNNRVILKGETVVQRTDYYPSGLPFPNMYQPDVQKFKYNNREFDTMHGLNQYDYGARFYDPAIMRWQVLDPLTEKYPFISPYAYCANNPIRLIDPDGKIFVDANGKKITYTQGVGWSKNATDDIKYIYAALMLTETGQKQWNMAYNDTGSKIQMKFVNATVRNDEGERRLGITHAFDNIENPNMTIEIFEGSIREAITDASSVNYGFTYMQIVGAAAGHEIEHTTKENRKMQIENKQSIKSFGYKIHNEERKPKEIERTIRNESRLSMKNAEKLQAAFNKLFLKERLDYMKSLGHSSGDPTDSFHDIINQMSESIHNHTVQNKDF